MTSARADAVSIALIAARRCIWIYAFRGMRARGRTIIYDPRCPNEGSGSAGCADRVRRASNNAREIDDEACHAVASDEEAKKRE